MACSFEIVEIKHNILIDKYLILDIVRKIKDTKIDSYDDFLKSYTKNLISDAENFTEVKGFHLTEWNNIRKKYVEGGYE